MLAADKLGALMGDRVEAALDEFSPSAAALLLRLHHRGVMTASALASILGVARPMAVVRG